MCIKEINNKIYEWACGNKAHQNNNNRKITESINGVNSCAIEMTRLKPKENLTQFVEHMKMSNESWLIEETENQTEEVKSHAAGSAPAYSFAAKICIVLAATTVTGGAVGYLFSQRPNVTALDNNTDITSDGLHHPPSYAFKDQIASRKKRMPLSKNHYGFGAGRRRKINPAPINNDAQRESRKGGFDFGVKRGYSGAVAGKHNIGKGWANNPNFPG